MLDPRTSRRVSISTGAIASVPVKSLGTARASGAEVRARGFEVTDEAEDRMIASTYPKGRRAVTPVKALPKASLDPFHCYKP